MYVYYPDSHFHAFGDIAENKGAVGKIVEIVARIKGPKGENLAEIEHKALGYLGLVKVADLVKISPKLTTAEKSILASRKASRKLEVVYGQAKIQQTEHKTAPIDDPIANPRPQQIVAEVPKFTAKQSNFRLKTGGELEALALQSANKDGRNSKRGRHQIRINAKKAKVFTDQQVRSHNQHGDAELAQYL